MNPALHRRKILFGIVASVSITLAATVHVQLQAERSWQAMVALGEEIREQQLAQPQARPPLWGEATDENAFAHYQRAADLIACIDGGSHTLSKMFGKSDAAVAELAGQLRTMWQPGLMALQTGAHSLRASHRPQAVADDKVLNLLTYRTVVNAAMLEARILRHRGDVAGSMQLTLDAMTMAADIFHSGVIINQMIGIALLEIAMDPWSDESLAQLDPRTAAAFARGLKRLDQRMPTRMLTRCETLFMVEHLKKVPDQSDWYGIGTWSYGFSQRWMLADAVLMTASNFERLEQVPDEDWPTRKALFDQIVAEVLASGNTAAHCMFPNLVAAELSIRHTIGNVRLLRMALDLHRGVVGEPLADPFGPGTLQVEQIERNLLIKSIGNTGHRKLERLVAL